MPFDIRRQTTFFHYSWRRMDGRVLIVSHQIRFFEIPLASKWREILSFQQEIYHESFYMTPHSYPHILIYKRYLRIDRNFVWFMKKYTQSGCTHWITQGCVQPDWGYFEWTEQTISIKSYKLIQTFFVMILKNIFIFLK